MSSYRGIKRNEKADNAANEAHQLQYITISDTTIKGKKIIEGKLKRNMERNLASGSVGKQNVGTHLAHITSGVEKWTWRSESGQGHAENSTKQKVTNYNSKVEDWTLWSEIPCE